MKMQDLVALFFVTMFLAASSALAGAKLQVDHITGDRYIVTAVDEDNTTIKYWSAQIDEASGCVFSFLDFTDPSGGTTDYMGTNGGYGRKCSMLQFYGRGGSVGTRNGSVAGLATKLAFATASDGAAFTITYTETDLTSGYFQSSYGSDSYALTPGDLLTSITVTLRPPTSEGTVWDWSISQRNVSDHLIDTRVWAIQGVRSYTTTTIPKTLTKNQDYVNGLWNEASPVSFGRYTVGANSVNVTQGRQFIIDYRYDLELYDNGNSASESAWAGFNYMEHKSPYTTNRGLSLKPGKTRLDAGQFRFNIAAPATGDVPIANAGADQSIEINTVDPATVNLDGSASTDTDGTIVSYTWVDIEGNEMTTGETPTLVLPEGDYYITLIVEDDLGNIACDEVHVEVAFQWDYTLYDAWPGRDPSDPNQLVNLYGQSISRPVITDLVWPANPGEADVCLYADDKFAAASLTVDDNTVPDHAFWIDQCNQHGFEMVWFVIVGDHRLNSGNGYFGTWEVFQTNIVDNGQEVQSHTVSHAGDDDVRPADEMHWEYSYSRALIDANLTDNRCLTIAYPSGNARSDIAAEYYIAGRGVTGGINLPHNTNYMNTKGGVLRSIPDMLNPAASSAARGWVCPLWHLIEDQAAEADALATAATYSDQVWFGSFTNVAKYSQERDTATLTVESADETAGVRMTLTDRMWDDAFDFPLTIKVRVWNSWTACAAVQAGQPVDAELITHDGDNYVLLKAVPDRGTIFLTNDSAATAGDADGDGVVDINDFFILKNNFGATDASWTQGDFDGDGDVDIDDFIILKNNFET